jgi:alpha-beta hydrolase superfamily lysophospholipase
LSGTEFAPPNPSACLIVLHGLAEHRGRYELPMQHFAASGIACIAYDQRGHGRSPGARADVQHFSQFADDFATIRCGVAARYPRLPIFVWGHSLGSIVALCSALDPRNTLSGAITTGCAVRALPALPVRAWCWTSALAGVLPTIRVNPGLTVQFLSRDPKVQQDYLRDPLVQQTVAVRLLAELACACGRVLHYAPAIRIPWLAVHGADDPIAPPAGSRDLVARLGSTDKQLVIEPGLLHEVHNEAEPAATRFRERVVSWIRERENRVAGDR